MRSRSNFKTVSDFTSTASKWRDNEAQTRQCGPHSRQISKQKQNKRADSRCNLMCFLPKKRRQTIISQIQRGNSSAAASSQHLPACCTCTHTSHLLLCHMCAGSLCLYVYMPRHLPPLHSAHPTRYLHAQTA